MPWLPSPQHGRGARRDPSRPSEQRDERHEKLTSVGLCIVVSGAMFGALLCSLRIVAGDIPENVQGSVSRYRSRLFEASWPVVFRPEHASGTAVRAFPCFTACCWCLIYA